MDAQVAEYREKRPTVFRLLSKILQSQFANHSRFIPCPFLIGPQIDIDRVKAALIRIKRDERDADSHTLERVMITRILVDIQEPVEKSVGNAHWQQYKVVWSADVERRFEQPGQKPEYLYHGSTFSNWYSILMNGLKNTSGTAWMTAGAAHGNGIYCSDNLNISFGYSLGVISSASTIPLVGVYEIYNSAAYQKTSGIFVIPDDKKVLLRYLLCFNTHCDIARVQEYMKQDLETRSVNKAMMIVTKNKKADARIAREIIIVRASGLFAEQIQPYKWQIGAIFVEFPFDFPFTAPILNGQAVASWTTRDTLLEHLDKSL